MLSSAKIGRSSWRYYQSTVVAGACEYYAERGDAEGRWHGAGLAELGLVADAVVVERELEALFGRGLHPVTGVALGRAWRADAVTGHDLTFSAPKSVSALWALASPATAAVIRDAHTTAVHAALDYLQTHASYSRRGRDGVEQIATAGYAAALFDHTTSRAGDPQLHTHALVVNKVRCADGAWRTIDGHEVFHHKKAAGALYQAALRAELTTKLGVAWSEVSEHGQAEIDGVPHDLLVAWSTRTTAVMGDAMPTIADVEETLGREVTRDERARIIKTAVLSTRPVKDHDVTAADLKARWRAQADELGWTPARVQESVVAARDGLLMSGEVSPVAVIASAATEQHDLEAPVSVISSVAGRDARELVTSASVFSSVAATTDGPDRSDWTQSVLSDAVASVGRSKAIWSRADLSVAIAARIPATGPDAPRSATDAAALIERLATDAVATTDHDAVSLGLDPSGVTARASDARFASRETVELEAGILEGAITGGFNHPARIDPQCAEILWTGVNERLSAQQRQAALRLVASLDLVTVMTAPAGAGKSTTLGAAADFWQAQGRSLVCLGPSARAAAELGDSVGTGRGQTVARWLTARAAAARDAVVIVDEASMLSTRDLAALIARVHASRSQLVLVGDPAQIGAVRAPGGMFEHLTHVLRTRVIGLDELHRFTDPDEAAATLRLREGDSRVLALYEGAGRIHPAASSADAADAVFHHWHREIEAGRDALMLAQTWTDVTALNVRARAAGIATGQITGDPLLTVASRTASTRGQVEQRDWRSGDVLLAKKNTRDLYIGPDPLRNGDRLRVLASTPDQAGLVVADLRGRGMTVLPREYLARWAEYGWASTIDGAQGATTDVAITLARSGLDREHLYVAMTRGRDANHIHTTPEVTTGDAGPDRPRAIAASPARGEIAGQVGLPVGEPVVPASPPTPALGDLREAMRLLRGALETSGRERAAHALLDPVIAAQREVMFEQRHLARELRRHENRPPFPTNQMRDNAYRLDRAVEDARMWGDRLARLTALLPQQQAQLEGLSRWARRDRATLTQAIQTTRAELVDVGASLTRAETTVADWTARVDADTAQHTSGNTEQGRLRRDRDYRVWADRDQRRILDLDADQLHNQAQQPAAVQHADYDRVIRRGPSRSQSHGIDGPSR
ncbi:MAG: MobF family relaxase [Candidatus Nanopelagicales bacterium]